jgi:hypothetical protein
MVDVDFIEDVDTEGALPEEGVMVFGGVYFEMKV